jgi:signal transduction histidine kinase
VTLHPATVNELRVLVAAPVGRDAEVTCEVLRGGGIHCHSCASLDEIARELEKGAGVILVTSEAVGPGETRVLGEALEAQEPWSDIPFVLAIAPGDTRARESALGLIGRAVAVTVLERPIRQVTLRTVLRAALRARQRQYELRDLLEQLRVHVARLDAEGTVRERFVSLLAHDLRGPLSTATLAARVLAGRPEQLEQRRDLALRIERSLLRIDRMVQDLLDANRLRAGHRLPLQLQPCDLVELIADVVGDLAEREREQVRVTAPDRLEGVWDPDQLRRAVWNLVTNALKYGDPGAPAHLLVEVSGRDVLISVQNSGPSIPADEQTRIFEPFGRATGVEGRARGWGLGLTLVRGCAEAHGGTVAVASTEESGTTFTIRLPLDTRSVEVQATVGG